MQKVPSEHQATLFYREGDRVLGQIAHTGNLQKASGQGGGQPICAGS